MVDKDPVTAHAEQVELILRTASTLEEHLTKRLPRHNVCVFVEFVDEGLEHTRYKMVAQQGGRGFTKVWAEKETRYHTADVMMYTSFLALLVNDVHKNLPLIDAGGWFTASGTPTKVGQTWTTSAMSKSGPQTNFLYVNEAGRLQTSEPLDKNEIEQTINSIYEAWKSSEAG